jgi:hypothetical protein
MCHKARGVDDVGVFNNGLIDNAKGIGSRDGGGDGGGRRELKDQPAVGGGLRLREESCVLLLLLLADNGSEAPGGWCLSRCG